jgi:FHA domain
LNSVNEWNTRLDEGYVFEQPGFWWARLNGAALEELWHKTGAFTDAMTDPSAGPERPLVSVVVKGTRNAFAMGVTISRFASNDVVVDHASVSRFHAWLVRDTDGGHRVFDADSHNGTWVNAVRANSKRGVLVKDTDVIRLGQTQLVFLSPQSLEARVRASRSAP